MTRAAGALLLVFAGAAACSPARERRTAAPLPPAPPSAEVSATPPADAGAPSDPKADAAVAEALALVSRVRGLAVKAPVPGVRLDRDALRAEVRQLMEEEAPPELISGQTELLFALDTVPASFDLKAALALLYGSQLAGFYDPKKKRMVLASDLGEDGERMTLYHELVHALQDQHFGLDQALDWKPEQSDALAALQALCEGDATSAMLDVFAAAAGQPPPNIPPGVLRLDSLMMQATPDLATVPGILARSIIAPYADGLGFVATMRRSGDWTAIDLAWQRRPQSTEQILHPDKYLVYEPVAPVAPIAPPPGFSESYRDVMGEQSLRLIFEDWAPSARAVEAATGWGGDRLAVFNAGQQRVVLWHLVFDTEPAARRALVAFARGAARPELPPVTEPGLLRDLADAEQAAHAARPGQFCRERAQRGPFAAVRQGRHIGVTLGPYARTGTDVRAAGTCPQSLAFARQLAGQK